jgi:Exo-beta-D-glucosaminidase Ig-fold domain/Concanavalin A-like lectin/glucanases superfamily/Glycosyl hydrolases family 2/Glycosyl hydrolases family 2, sugar binding domain
MNRLSAGLLLVLGCCGIASAELPVPGALGPYNVRILQGGIGLERALPQDTPTLQAGAPWTLSSWVKLDQAPQATVTIAALGALNSGSCVCLQQDAQGLAVRLDEAHTLHTPASLMPGTWTLLTVTYDGQTLRLYVQGQVAGQLAIATGTVAPELSLGPASGAHPDTGHFGGSLAQFQFSSGALAPEAVQAAADQHPDFDLVAFTAVGVGWPLQVRAWTGLLVPQDPWTLPHAHAARSPPHVAPVSVSSGVLRESPAGHWSLSDWRMQAAPIVEADPAALSQAAFDDLSWYPATVPGTVLTTLIARGVYPDPDIGLNNLAIPESLARQDYWYRTHFLAPAQLAGRHVSLLFNGINYAAQVWVNGVRVGAIRGAFTRGVFDISALLHPGSENVVAVRISPPPHPGIPSEESMAYGPGENGGAMALDGPTFIATEGWDWIPGIRDRDTGLWQGIELISSGAVHVVDPSVITQLPLPRIDSADLTVQVPLQNEDAQPHLVTVQAAFEGVVVSQTVRVPPGRSEVQFAPSAYPVLHVIAPRLWWPNGYGAPELYHLSIEVRDGKAISDSATLRFGIRELTYELSLFDQSGHLRRVEVDPTAGSMRKERLIDTRHEAIKRVPNGWAASLTAAGESSPAVHPVASESLSPYLVIRVNGTPIAARGGSWGMDDARKRISRERLEPYFRLHREAGVNIIRNWLGQNTEEVFYDLADENGLLVLNDFWISTQDFQLEPEDPALFLANAADVIARYRHHPSIAVWFGRNEGVPQPIINEGLAALVADLDGTRYYTGSSNRINLQDSGPYNYRSGVSYFTDLGAGFAVEIGTPSLATLESLQAMVPAADRWPISDTLAYHDWHFGGNGDVDSFMAALARQFGTPSNLEDFERKAQMMNYVDYRAIFEGFAAHLWTQNSGRLIWMSHPAWPSNHWQMYDADYDTNASYYGVKKACEPLHVQLNLPDYALAVVNTTRSPAVGLSLRSRVLSLANVLLAERVDRLDAAANQTTTLAPVALSQALAREGLVLVVLTLSDSGGHVLSENTYWQGATESSLQRLNELPAQRVRLTGYTSRAGEDSLVRVILTDQGLAPALAVKLTLLDRLGRRILPAYYSDNYLTLLPGEPHEVTIRYPGAPQATAVSLRGWNVRPGQSIATPVP